MKKFKIIILIFTAIFCTTLSAESLFYKTNKIQSRNTIIEEPSDIAFTYVKRFNESANVKVWKDTNTSKFYLKIYPISDKIFIANNTHSIKQFQDGIENTYTLQLKDTTDNSLFFDYVYKDTPQTLEIVVDDEENFDSNKTFDFMFENTYRVPLNQKSNTGEQCINLSMQKGWSLVSLPVAITLEENSNDSNTSMDRLGNYEKIFIYNDGNWVKNPSTITAGQGFWIKQDNDYTEEFCGKAYNPIIEDLSTGWHLVGTGKTLYNINHIDYINHSFKYNNNEWSEDFNTTVPGEGFWVQIGTKEDITIPVVPIDVEDNSTIVSDALKFDTTNRNVSITKIEDYSFKVLQANKNDYSKYIGKPLFIAKIFEGIIQSIEQDNSDLLITTKNASDLKDVYEEIKFRFNGITDSQSRNIIKNKKVYTYLNKEPMIINFINKNKINSRGVSISKPFVQMAIPNNYIIQNKNIQSRASYKKEIPISVDLQNDTSAVSLSFMNGSQWSYLEFELDTKMNNFDYKILSTSPFLMYDMEMKLANVQDIKIELSGKISVSLIEKSFFPLPSFNIPIPVSAGILSLKIQPKIDVNFTGELSGKYAMSYKNSYSKTTFYSFDTRLDEQIQRDPIISDPAVDYSSQFAAEVNGGISIAPILEIEPQLGIPKTDMNIKLFDVESGYEVSYKATGQLVVNESGLQEDYPFTKNYFIHDFFPWYVDTGAEGQAFASGKIDLSNIPIIGDIYQIKFALLPKQVLWKMDLGGMPEPTITEISSKTDTTKTVQISFPESANGYLDKIQVTYENKSIDFTSGRTQIVENLTPDTNYTFTATWKENALTSSEYDKSLIVSNSLDFRTSIFEESETNTSSEQSVNDILGQWTLHLKCINESSDASIFNFNIISNSSSSTIYSIQGEGTGTDYGGESMVHIVNGTYNIETNVSNISISTTFPGTNEYTRTDTFSTNLDVNDTGYVNTTQSWHPSDGGGCDGAVRLHR